MKSSTPTSVEETLCQMREVRVAAVVADEETENKAFTAQDRSEMI
jgi:hypothetical protein